jgi:hypothetical protein
MCESSERQAGAIEITPAMIEAATLALEESGLVEPWPMFSVPGIVREILQAGFSSSPARNR